MKTKTIALLLVLLLLVPALPALAGEYRETAMTELTQRYNVPPERVELYEGHIMPLDHIGESFWTARYIILPEGQTASEKPQDLPADTPVSDRGLPDENSSDVYGNQYGAIYIREKTGEIISHSQLDEYLNKNQDIATREWERLSREAGKLDVPLYQKVQTLPASETVNVIILPAFVETEELKARFEALKAEYPQFSEGVTSLSEQFNFGFGYALPLPMPEIELGVVPDAQILPLPIEEVEKVLQGSGIDPVEGTEPGRPGMDDRYWQEYSDFYEKLDAIRVDGLRPALAAIAAALDELGVDYEQLDGMLTAELTTAQIRQIADLAEVQSIHEDAIFTTMDGVLRTDDLAGEAAPAMYDASPESTRSPFPYTILIAAAAILAAAAFFIRKVRLQN